MAHTLDLSIYHFFIFQTQQLERQEHALRWAIAVDGMADPSSVPTTGRNEEYVPRPKLSFRHSDIFRTALLFERTAYSMIAEAEAGTIEGKMAGI